MRFTEQANVRLTACPASELLMLVEQHLRLKLSSSIYARTQVMPRAVPLVVNLGYFISSQNQPTIQPTHTGGVAFRQQLCPLNSVFFRVDSKKSIHGEISITLYVKIRIPDSIWKDDFHDRT